VCRNLWDVVSWWWWGCSPLIGLTSDRSTPLLRHRRQYPNKYWIDGPRWCWQLRKSVAVVARLLLLLSLLFLVDIRSRKVLCVILRNYRKKCWPKTITRIVLFSKKHDEFRTISILIRMPYLSSVLPIQFHTGFANGIQLYPDICRHCDGKRSHVRRSKSVARGGNVV